MPTIIERHKKFILSYLKSRIVADSKEKLRKCSMKYLFHLEISLFKNIEYFNMQYKDIKKSKCWFKLQQETFSLRKHYSFRIFNSSITFI